MSKSERLFQLVNLLRARRTAITAEQLSDVMEVSIRTTYRDIQALTLSGVPIEGEAGVGYRLRPGYQLPPLMFSFDEMQALLLGARMVDGWTDCERAKGAQRALQKIKAVLPPELLADAEQHTYRVPKLDAQQAVRETHLVMRRACEQHQKLSLNYRDAQQQETQRVVWPLGMLFWGQHWTLLAWCEIREDYRNFRLDRVLSVAQLEDRYENTDMPSLKHYMVLMHTAAGENNRR